MTVPDRTRRTAVIGLSPTDWEGPPSGHARLLKGLGEAGWDVVYSEGQRSVWDLGRRPALLLAHPFGSWRRAGPVLVDQPGCLPPRWMSRPAVDRLAIAWHGRRLRQAARAKGAGRTVALITHPLYQPYAEILGADRLIFLQFDAYSLTPSWNQDLAVLQARLVQAADLIIANSAAMAAHLPGDGPARAQILPHGVDWEMFAGGARQPCPADLATVPHPRIGYVGRVSLKVDLPLIAELARRRPGWHFVLVGPVGRGDSGEFPAGSAAQGELDRLRPFGNVHFLGSKRYQDVPAYMAHFDVNALFYRTSDQGHWNAGFPMKLYECLASGRPVVCADLVSVRDCAALMPIASGANEWEAALEGALADSSPVRSGERQALARANTWQSRTETIAAWIDDLFR